MKLVFATHNLNKYEEVKELMPAHIELLSLHDINQMEEIPETQPTIEGNALQKARFVKDRFNLNCFADDTGLEVSALDGAPGVFSARYAGPKKDPNDNMNKLLQQLSNKDDRSAQFKTIIALLLNGKEYLFEGICEGTITKAKIGSQGFGYDPVFKPKGSKITFGEMQMSDKAVYSHRAKGIKKLINFLNN
ncbi:non-canonical purine NTP diphosphatase [Gangjinia marincola]|uniref:dITP/XTP pyrophosphatase n=1 Tax=Gangjinia marincola TaxID=578463 RepID=A0ABN1MFM4_9FLAO